MHYADIIAALHKCGHKPSEVADELGVDRSAISLVIHGHTKSKRIANRISEVTAISVNELWPSKYKDSAE